MRLQAPKSTHQALSHSSHHAPAAFLDPKFTAVDPKGLWWGWVRKQRKGQMGRGRVREQGKERRK